MRRTFLAPLVSLLLPLLAAACGEAPAPVRGAPDAWIRGKPNPLLGQVEAGVVDRPAADRARIRARYTRLAGTPSCRIELVLPDGVLLREGEADMPLPADAQQGEAQWVVELPSGRTLDAVVRLRAEGPRGTLACEVPVRLVERDGDPRPVRRPGSRR
jgi:hypothetical protein